MIFDVASAPNRHWFRPPVVFTGEQALAVGTGFAHCVERSRISIVACSIMPKHTHLVINRPPYSAEQATNLLKGAATTELRSLRVASHLPRRATKRQTPITVGVQTVDCFLEQ